MNAMLDTTTDAAIDALDSNGQVSQPGTAFSADGEENPNTDKQAQRDKSLAKLYDFGKAEGKASKRENLFKQIGDEFHAGLWDFTEPTKGRPKKNAPAAEPTDMDAVFGKYAAGVRSQNKGKSPGCQISKLTLMARWGAGKAVWEYPKVLKEGLDYHAEMVLQNADAKKNKLKVTPIDSPSVVLLNLAALQTDQKNGHNDRRLTEEEVKSCVLKATGEGKPYVEKLDSFIELTTEEITDDHPAKELFEKAAEAMRELHAVLAQNYEREQAIEKDHDTIADLIDRGVLTVNAKGAYRLA